MTWGGLNPALTAFRNAVNARLSERDDTTDGGYADPDHGSNSQHQPDSDGTVDAWDMDTNLLSSSVSTGSAEELQLIEALKLDFQRDGRAHLWIHNRQISQHDEDWRRYSYGGSSPHTEHVHWECRQDRETDGKPWNLPNLEKALKVTEFSPEAKAALAIEATHGVLTYDDNGLPSWDGQPTNRNFLNSFTYMFGMVEGLVSAVAELQETVSRLSPSTSTRVPRQAAPADGSTTPGMPGSK